MSESFSVGEIAILNLLESPWHGWECVVIEAAKARKWRQWMTREPVSGIAYVIRFDGKDRFVVRPENLRKRRPPQDWVKLCHLTDLPREVTHV